MMNSSRRVFVAAAAAGLAGCATTRSADTGQTGKAPINGTQIYYEVLGKGDPVIFVHGLTLDTRMWDDQFFDFAKRYRTVRYDARGYGRSGPVTGPFSIREDLRALMDHLDVKRAHIIGLSMGGRYAIEFALTHPDRVSSLVTVDAVLPGLPTPNFGKEIGAIIAAGSKGNIADAKHLWLASSLFTPAREQPAVAARLKKMVDDYSGWHFANGLGKYEENLNPPAAQRLAEIKAPTLVVVGEREIPELIAVADKITREVTGAYKVVIPNAGHMSNMEAPVVFNRMVLDWLAANR